MTMDGFFVRNKSAGQCGCRRSVITLWGAKAEQTPRLIVCGDNPLAYRLVEELVTRISDEVTVILPSAKQNHGPRIAALPKVRLIEAPELSEGAFRAARVEQANALALVGQDDVSNIHVALRAQELNSDLQLVIRFFNMSLGHRIRTLFPRCTVLSDAATAAPRLSQGHWANWRPTTCGCRAGRSMSPGDAMSLRIG